MPWSRCSTAAAPWSIVAALCVSILLVNLQKKRGRRSMANINHGRGLNAAVDVAAAALDMRAPPENDQTFSLYENPEAEPTAPPMELSESVLVLLKSFDVDPVRGFLPRIDPLRRLPQAELQPWETLAVALPSLLAVGQARKPIEALPELSVDVLTCHRERMRALLLLCVFAHASVWGNPEQPEDTIPKGVAVPLVALAGAEGLPPLLTHTSLVLHNWHRLDPSGPIRAENLACNCRFLGGLDETWFYIATVEIEARGGGVFGALLEAQRAIAEAASTLSSDDAAADANDGGNDASSARAAQVVGEALAVARAGIVSMREALARMPVGCHPLIFYKRVRPFLSGWKANPTLPNGIVYEGVSTKRQFYYGGSAAQSTLFPALDAALGVSHSAHSSNAFLLDMRNYMPPGHRRLVEHLSDPACPSIRCFIQNFPASSREEQRACGKASRPGESGDNVSCVTASPQGSPRNAGHETDSSSRSGGGRPMVESSAAEGLREAYNGCLDALAAFRSTHLSIVGSYILQQQKKDQKAGEAKSREDFAGGKGTGGTPLLDFLKPLKNDSRAVLLK